MMMSCPKCEGSALLERERDGVVVDVCPQCRGVWLDKGELEKLIVKSVEELNTFSAPRGAAPDSDRHPQYDQARGSHSKAPDSDRDPRYGHPKRKRSWLESLGDVFD